MKRPGDDAEAFDRVLVLDDQAQHAAQLGLIRWRYHPLDGRQIVVGVADAFGVDGSSIELDFIGAEASLGRLEGHVVLVRHLEVLDE